ncbi:diguanylate cyclase [Hippea sp. KM1]|uniref:diguanylate cyclase n=1 Tax=Hippea sp. KM1 TaxID=944481 RepID=UPI00046D8E3D|nr:diguanylate cyclase [Hippea sp. KM1]
MILKGNAPLEDCKRIYSRGELKSILNRFEITEADIEKLRGYRDFIKKYSMSIAEDFIVYLKKEPSVGKIFDGLGGDAIKGIQERLKFYLEDMFEGRFDEGYVEKRLLVGMIHHERGINEEFYVSSYWKIFDVMGKYAASAFSSEDLVEFLRLTFRVILMDTTMTLRFYFCVKSRSVNYFKEMSEKDYLTRIYNRKKFEEILEKTICRADRYVKPMSLVMFDIDDFKRINDEFGHKAGDELLKEIADLVSENIRQCDYFVRWGGDEFIIILPETDINGAYRVGEKLRKMVENHRFSIGKGVTISVGVIEHQAGESCEDVFKRLDEVLYRSKNMGKNKTIIENEPLAG